MQEEGFVIFYSRDNNIFCIIVVPLTLVSFLGNACRIEDWSPFEFCGASGSDNFIPDDDDRIEHERRYRTASLFKVF